MICSVHWQSHKRQLLFESRTFFTGVSKLVSHTVQNMFWHFTGPFQSLGGAFVLQNNHRLPAEFIACLRLEIAFQIKKLWTKWWFYTVCKKSLCNSVTSKVWKNLAENWFLGGLWKFNECFYMDIRYPKSYFVNTFKFSSSQTAKIPFEILENVTVWLFASLSECSLFWKKC